MFSAASSLSDSRHLLGIQGLSRSQIELLLDQADSAVDLSRQVEKKRNVLRGRTLINLFFGEIKRALRGPFYLFAFKF